MADLYIRELKEQIAHYEAIMSRCPQCKTNLPTPEAESSTATSVRSRSKGSAQQPTTKAGLPALTGPSERPIPEAESSTATSVKSRSKSSIQQPAAKVPPPAPTCHSEQSTPEAESTTTSSGQSRSNRSAQQPAAKAPPPAPTCHSERPTPEAESIIVSSGPSRLTRSAQQPAAKVPAPALTDPSERLIPEAESIAASSRQSRSGRSAQLSAEKVPASTLTDPSERLLPEAEPIAASSRQSRSGRSAQLSAEKVPASTLTDPSERLVPEAEPIAASSRQSRSGRSAQLLAEKVPAPALTGLSKPLTLSSSNRASKQLHPASRTKKPASDSQQCTPSIPSAISSDPSHQANEAPVSTLWHPSTVSSDHSTTVSATASTVDSSRQPAIASQNSSTRPSSGALWTAEEMHRHSGKLVDLDLEQQHKKHRSRTMAGRPPGESPRHAEWKRMADIMLDEVPSGRHWREKLTKMDSSIIAAVAIGSVPVDEGDMHPTEDVEREKLIRLVRRFAQRHSEGRVNFEHFILVCLCKVLSSQGVPQRDIVETLQICISDTSQQNIGRYLKGATWANSMMYELFLTDWGYRAIDLIAIWNRSIATYGKIAAAPDSRQYFITGLTQRKYFEGYQEISDRRHDTIPWIIKKELGNEVSYRDICEALGYSNEYILKTRSLHSSQPPSPNMDSGSSADEDATRGENLSQRGRKLADHTSRHQRQKSAGVSPNRASASMRNLTDDVMIRRQLHLDDSSDDSGGRKDQIASESVASQSKKRMVPDRSAKPLGDPDVTRQRRKPYEEPSLAKLPVSTSLGEDGASSTQRTALAENAPPRPPVYGDPHLEESPQLPRTSFQNASRDHAAGRDPLTSQIGAAQQPRNIVPDRSIKPLRDPDVARRRKPSEKPSSAECPVSTSLGEPAPGIQSTKRPLPESPTSAFQPINATRRRPPVVDRSSSEEISPPSHSGKRGSNNQRRRA